MSEKIKVKTRRKIAKMKQILLVMKHRKSYLTKLLCRKTGARSGTVCIDYDNQSTRSVRNAVTLLSDYTKFC